MSEPAAAKPSTVSLVLKAVIAIAVTALTLWWAFADVDTERLRSDLARTSTAAVLLFVGAHVVMHAARTVRWALLIAPLGASPRLAFSSISVGIPAAFFLPLRLGEFVRPAFCARHGVPFAGAMAAVAVERVADGIVNVGVFFILLRALPESAALPSELTTLSNVALAGFGAGVAFLFATYFARDLVVRTVTAIFAPISPKVGDKIAHLATTFVDGLAGLRSVTRLLGFFATTAVYWGVNGAATWMLASSYVEHVDFVAGPFTVGVTVFAVMIPAGPAFAGTLEAGYRLGLAPFGVPASAAAVVAVVSHAVQLVFMGAIAGVGALFTPTTKKT
ncbi:MAG: lysylphosphatidylglycerol synthase transmembrane domain-containing protein [Deltaproteobacteria bacterium]